ncbi:hypothetical protein OAP45_02745 [Candidatus Pelagibacter sp.]|jgi:hypothetical protein|nr:hypothetical protein [Candidatus Pelagibacter sp.]
MPTPSITTTYAGEFAGKYISAALLSGNTIANGGITVKPNVKYKEVVKKVATSGLIGNASCDFTDAGSLTLTERILQPEEFQVNLELCKKDFRSDWEAVQMGYSAYDNLPPKFADFLIGHVAAKVAEQTEQNIWQGTDATAGEFDGLATLLAADGDVVDVTGTTVTSANVIAELGKIVDAIPSAVYGKEDLKIYVSSNIAKAYVSAQAALGYRDLYHVGKTEMNFQGIPLFVANGLADNDAVAAETSNLYFGTGLLADHNEVKVIDMADLDGSQNVRIVMRFTAGVQYGIGSDIVLYT